MKGGGAFGRHAAGFQHGEVDLPGTLEGCFNTEGEAGGDIDRSGSLVVREGHESTADIEGAAVLVRAWASHALKGESPDGSADASHADGGDDIHAGTGTEFFGFADEGSVFQSEAGDRGGGFLLEFVPSLLAGVHGSEGGFVGSEFFHIPLPDGFAIGEDKFVAFLVEFADAEAGIFLDLQEGTVREGKVDAAIGSGDENAAYGDALAFLDGLWLLAGGLDEFHGSGGFDDDGDAGLAVGAGAFLDLIGFVFLRGGGEGAGEGEKDGEE